MRHPRPRPHHEPTDTADRLDVTAPRSGRNGTKAERPEDPQAGHPRRRGGPSYPVRAGASRVMQHMRSPKATLTDREDRHPGQLARGLGNREIAKALFISEATVKTSPGPHLRQILGVDTRAAPSRSRRNNGCCRSPELGPACVSRPGPAGGRCRARRQAPKSWWSRRTATARPTALAPLGSFRHAGEWADASPAVVEPRTGRRETVSTSPGRMRKSVTSVYLLIDRKRHEMLVHSEPDDGIYATIVTRPFGKPLHSLSFDLPLMNRGASTRRQASAMCRTFRRAC
ncbi:response regulator transcription factor, partial [Yinghuangia aomiensis]